jgi:2-dehydro-3-deoxygalactonokinase
VTRANARQPRLIAVDWGTSSLRAWLMGPDGEIQSARRRAEGLLNIAERPAVERAAEYERIYTALTADWTGGRSALPAIACGMVGSTEGWADAGYLTVPTELTFGMDALTVIPHAGGRLYLVPGLRIGSHDDAPGDLLRGEESQLVGALDVIGHDVAGQTFVLPGTHTKWVRVDNGKVTSFTTVMTGELFGLVTHHGLLARTASTGCVDDHAFERGLQTAPGRGLPAELFGGRALVLDGLLDPGSLPDYVSGVLIADELGHQLPKYASSERLVVCGDPDLCGRYARALTHFGVRSCVVTEDATARGLWRIAADAGLIDISLADAQEEHRP